MPAVISDASVLISLGATRLLHLLRDFYGEIFIPPAVWREVTEAGERPGADEVTTAKRDGWIQIKAPASELTVRALREHLDEGEAEAIALAEETANSLLLIDESEGRQTASRLGIAFTGTIGVLLRARKAGRVTALKPTLDLLIQTHSFRLSRAMYESILRETGEFV